MNESIEPLSEREIEILRLVATGVSNKEIASALSISPNTVKVHLRNIFAKIGVLSRTEATIYAIKNGIVEQPSPANSGFSSLEPYTPPEAISPIGLASQSITESDQSRRAPIRKTILWAGIVMVVLITVIYFSNAIQVASSPTPTQGIPATAVILRWQEFTTLPEPRAGMGGVAYDNHFYLVGGSTPGGVSRDLKSFDLNTKEWDQLPDKPTAVSGIQAALIGGKIYVPGGERTDGTQSNLLEVFDPRQDRWETRASMPTGLSQYALAAYEGALYVFSGWDGEKYSDRIFRYDPDQDQWDIRQFKPDPRGGSAATSMEGRIVLLGGMNEQGGLKEVWNYYPDRDEDDPTAWEKSPDLPDARFGLAATSLANSIFVVGGQSTPGDKQSHAPIMLAPDADAWQALTQPTQPIGSAIVLMASGNFLHVLGGELTGELSDEHLVYQALYTVAIPLISNQGEETPPP